jgi:hypothetical protein
MNTVNPDVLGESWPLWEQSRHFELGHVLNSAITEALDPRVLGMIGPYHAGLWECDLADQSLIWSGGVYDLFGLERLAPVQREQVLAHYSQDSMIKLERLRAHSIANGVGFTLDAEIRAAAVGKNRRVRLIAAPVLTDGVAVRLHGLKLAL